MNGMLSDSLLMLQVCIQKQPFFLLRFCKSHCNNVQTMSNGNLGMQEFLI